MSHHFLLAASNLTFSARLYIEIDELPDPALLEKFDLVAISSFTARIKDAYWVADAYRTMGIPVVLGGIHVTLNPDEAAEHADSIVLYGAEGAWPMLVRDFEGDKLQPRYLGMQDQVFSDKNYVFPQFDLLAGRPYNRLTVQTSRGCPIKCEFCAASFHLTSSFQQKSVDKVIGEIKKAQAICQHPFFELADDNTFLNKKWGKEFLRAIIPLKINWFTETDISVADDDDLLELMAQSGLKTTRLKTTRLKTTRLKTIRLNTTRLNTTGDRRCKNNCQLIVE